MQIDHIGIVVKDIYSFALETSLLLSIDSKNVEYEYLDSQKVKIALIKLENVMIELLQPTDRNSTVFNFWQRGGGIHHICYLVDSIDQFLAQNKRRIKVIRNKQIGLQGRNTAFFLIRNNFNLIEIIEPPKCEELIDNGI
jgi:methylmalonyl-CoA/ethylmalonyl-CoA epimerase